MTVTTLETARRRSAPAGLRQRRGPTYRDGIARWLFVLPAAVYLVVFFGYPVVKNITMSFQEYTTRTFFTGQAPFIGLGNYRTVLESPLFTAALTNTLIFTAASMIGQFIIGLGLAVFFQRAFPLNGLLRSLLLLPWLLPLIVSGATWRWILDQDGGVLNQALTGIGIAASPIPWLSSPSVALVAVILTNIWISIPFTTVILHGGLQNIPAELYEAAALDGATGWRAFRHVTWPQLRPVLTVVLVLGVVYTVKVLDIILVLTGGGPANATQTIATQSYTLSFQQFDFGQGAAMGNVLILISLVFSVIYLRANRRSADV